MGAVREALFCKAMGQLCEAAQDRPMEQFVQLLLLQAGKWVRPDSGNAA